MKQMCFISVNCLHRSFVNWNVLMLWSILPRDGVTRFHHHHWSLHCTDISSRERGYLCCKFSVMTFPVGKEVTICFKFKFPFLMISAIVKFRLSIKFQKLSYFSGYFSDADRFCDDKNQRSKKNIKRTYTSCCNKFVYDL